MQLGVYSTHMIDALQESLMNSKQVSQCVVIQCSTSSIYNLYRKGDGRTSD